MLCTFISLAEVFFSWMSIFLTGVIGIVLPVSLLSLQSVKWFELLQNLGATDLHGSISCLFIFVLRFKRPVS